MTQDKSFLIQITSLDDLCDALRKVVREELQGKQQNGQEASKTYCNYLTRKEKAQQLKISLPTLDSYEKKGILTRILVGTRVLYREDDLPGRDAL